MRTYGAVKAIPAPRKGSTAKNPMSAFSAVTASTDFPAESKTASSTSTLSQRPNSRAKSIETPTGTPSTPRLARMGLPKLMDARSLPVGVNAAMTSRLNLLKALFLSGQGLHGALLQQ